MAAQGAADNETVDELGVCGWKVMQSRSQFRFGIDAVLLAHFATIRSRCQAVDLGAGTGAVGLFLLARGAATVHALEINPIQVDLVSRTARLNHIEDRLKVTEQDYRQINDSMPAGEFDLVAVNPPYRSPVTGRVSPHEGLAAARHETATSLIEVLAASHYLLRHHGRIAMIALPERLIEICQAMRLTGLEPKRLRFVHPFPAKPAKLFLIEGVKGSRPGLAVLPALAIYQSPGCYSDEIMSYYRSEG